MRLEVVGLETQRFAKGGNRVGEFSLARQRVAEVVVRGSIVRRNLQGLFEARDRLVKLSLGHQQIAEIVMGLRVIRIDSQGLEVLCFGGLPLALSGECQSQVVVHVFVLRT